MELARRIVEAAPQYAVSYAIQAGVNAAMTEGYSPHDARTAPAEIARLRKAVYDSAKRSIDLDPNIDAYGALAKVFDPAVGFAARERLWLKALSVDPGNIYALQGYATFLGRVGRIREARAYYKRALNEYPLDKRVLLRVANLDAVLGDIDIARDEFKEALQRYPGDRGVLQWWFFVEYDMGDPATALKMALANPGVLHPEPGRDPLKQDPFNCLRTVLDARSKRIHLSVDQINTACATGFHLPKDSIYVYFGEVDAAFAAMNARFDDFYYSFLFPETLSEPKNHVLHADPRFMPFAARLGLVDYWLESNHWPDFCTTEKLPYDCKQAAPAARASVKKIVAPALG